MMTYLIISLGCSKNLVDSERFHAILRSYGLQAAEEESEADIYLVNTCAFLNASFAELDDTLCDILSLTKGRKRKLIVTGCVMNRGLEEFKEMFPEVNVWIGLKDFGAFEKYLLRYVLPQGTPTKQLDYSLRKALQEEQFVYLRISDGCENNCSYCMIPSIRGKLVSEPIETLVQEAKQLSKKAYELVVIAQDSCLYGTDLYGEKALPRLLKALLDNTDFPWIRVMYMHPDHFELSWLELWQQNPRLLPYFEIPVQQVSETIIKAMNRQKSYAELKELFLSIKQALPEAVFRTTFMVGYPGEKPQDRKLIREFLAETGILMGGVFGYSPEKEGTPYNPPESYNWKAVEKLERELAFHISKRKGDLLQSYVGTLQPALIEGYSEVMNAYVGRLWFQAPEIDGIVYIEHNPNIKHPLVQVEITDALADELWAVWKPLKLL